MGARGMGEAATAPASSTVLDTEISPIQWPRSIPLPLLAGELPLGEGLTGMHEPFSELQYATEVSV